MVFLAVNEERPNELCVECGTVISKAILFPAKLKRHSEKNTLNLKIKIIKDNNYFTNKYQKLNNSKKRIELFVSKDHRNALIASYKSFRTA